jgi:hypothetical protein
MKYTIKLLALAFILIGVVFQAEAKQEKKNKPNSSEIKKALINAGGEHNPSDMDIDKIGSLEVENTYFHAFKGTIDKKDYRIILFNNNNEYLGFYALGKVQPAGFHEDSLAVISPSGPYMIKLGKDGPAKEIVINKKGDTCKFTSAPKTK